MRIARSLLAGGLTLLWSGAVFAQDAVKADPKHYSVLLENSSVRVLKISYAPGEKSVMHHHPDAIVIPLTSSKVRFSMADGKSEDSDLAAESAVYSAAGTHNPANIGTTRVDAILIELKGAGGSAALPATRPGMALKELAQGARAAAYRSTAAATFTEPAGTKHEFDQVVIALAPAQMSLSVDGKPAKTTWARGDIQFVGRGTPHEARNTGGKPVDMVIVAIK